RSTFALHLRPVHFYSCYYAGALRDPHSFPTRRSSDLGRRAEHRPERPAPRADRLFREPAAAGADGGTRGPGRAGGPDARGAGKSDRKSTRLNSSHVKISYAVFCLKKKKKTTTNNHTST